MKIQIRRIYETARGHDGTRILVDRIWPRGISKDKARLDAWWKDIAPSGELRKWVHHDMDRWEEFKDLYKQELRKNRNKLDELLDGVDPGKTLTLLYGSRDQQKNHAQILKEFIEEEILAVNR